MCSNEDTQDSSRAGKLSVQNKVPQYLATWRTTCLRQTVTCLTTTQKEHVTVTCMLMRSKVPGRYGFEQQPSCDSGVQGCTWEHFPFSTCQTADTSVNHTHEFRARRHNDNPKFPPVFFTARCAPLKDPDMPQRAPPTCLSHRAEFTCITPTAAVWFTKGLTPDTTTAKQSVAISEPAASGATDDGAFFDCELAFPVVFARFKVERFTARAAGRVRSRPAFQS
ncbi:hypothetical protein Bbelb_405090 [Branchiostoma belcheri]|nr:hypothetical protein Bbelb_405090 [Branchiostoma belcheri]